MALKKHAQLVAHGGIARLLDRLAEQHLAALAVGIKPLEFPPDLCCFLIPVLLLQAETEEIEGLPLEGRLCTGAAEAALGIVEAAVADRELAALAQAGHARGGAGEQAVAERPRLLEAAQLQVTADQQRQQRR